jgi:general secretion pathway protein J
MPHLPPPHAPRALRGFTLVEVLVALMIMAVIAGMAWRGVDGIVKTRDASNERLQQALRLNTVVAQWEQDLAALQETPAAPGLAFDGASLRLTRRAEGGLQVVVWSLRATSGLTAAGAADSSATNTWLRWAGPVVRSQSALQEAWLSTQQFQGVEPGQLRVLEGVSQWQVYFFRGGSWTNPQSTGNAAPGTTFVPTTRAALPSGVRLVLSLAPGQAREGSLTRDVALGPQLP